MTSCIDIDGMSQRMRSGWASPVRGEAQSARSSAHGADESSSTALNPVPLEQCTAPPVVPERITILWSTRPRSGLSMSKRKASKPSHGPKMAGPKIAVKAQRAAQAVVRSPSNNGRRPRRAGSTDPLPKHHDPEQPAFVVEAPVTALPAELPPKQPEPQQQALLVEKPAADLPDDGNQTMTDHESRNAPDLSSDATSVWAYQARLLELAQANMQFPFEFAQRLATIRSPNELFSVIAEFTNKRMAMFQMIGKK